MSSNLAFPDDPWVVFSEWFTSAQEREFSYPEAMTLASLDAEGRPTARIVLMKHYDTCGIVFHTNRKSRKGRGIEQHPLGALCFYWKTLQRQVRIEGIIAPVSDEESDAYFRLRPRRSQIGAWASRQSEILETRDKLDSKVAALERDYAGQDIPRPGHWGGYRLTPHLFEFWQEREFRLHDRVRYLKKANESAWSFDHLSP